MLLTLITGTIGPTPIYKNNTDTKPIDSGPDVVQNRYQDRF